MSTAATIFWRRSENIRIAPFLYTLASEFPEVVKKTMKMSFKNRLRVLFKSLKAVGLYAFFDNEEQAIRELEKCLERDPQNVPNLITLGEILIKKGMYLQGIEKLHEALQHISAPDKADSKIFAYLAYGYAELNRLDESILYYRRAITSWSKDGDFIKIELIYNLGRLYLQQRNYTEAKNTYTFGLDLDNKNARLHFGLGIAYYELGQYKDAFHHLETAIELEPTFNDDKIMKKFRHELKSKMTIH